jgi:glutamine---fructose-6-phosphate transaminase (isomerizing)
MCGIIACLGDIAAPYIINGLNQLQNRGYDSAGLSLIYENQWILKKYASEHSIQQLRDNVYPLSINGIGHTRWATHGAKTVENSHPHKSYNGTFMVVHNGIIENYKVLKRFLIQKDYIFYSQTDTEIIANLIDYYNKEYSVIDSIEKTIQSMEGTWGLCIQVLHEPNVLYCVRHGSPLLVGNGGHFALVSSEHTGFCGKINKYIELNDNDICKLEHINNEIHISTKENYSLRDISLESFTESFEPYSHWTQKEIYEQNNSILNTIHRYKDGTIELGLNKERFTNVEHIILLGCGTSYYSACIGSKYMKKWCNFVSVQVFDAGEFTKYDIPKGKCAFIMVSQSGETKDLQKCIELIQGHITIGVINKVDSVIARQVDYVCYLNAGREVGVASTKSFVSQVTLLSLISLWFAQLQSGIQDLNIIKDLIQLSTDIEDTLNINMKSYVHLFDKDCFILGKDYDEFTAKEGALKIKELSYIHAEGYSSSSLKHGPFALLETNFPVILICPRDEYWSKNENVYEEIKSRHATVISITNEPLEREHTIMVSKNNTYQCILNMIPLQLLAYELAISRGINPDKPRNLAKVVSVE